MPKFEVEVSITNDIGKENTYTVTVEAIDWQKATNLVGDILDPLFGHENVEIGGAIPSSYHVTDIEWDEAWEQHMAQSEGREPRDMTNLPKEEIIGHSNINLDKYSSLSHPLLEAVNDCLVDRYGFLLLDFKVDGKRRVDY